MSNYSDIIREAIRLGALEAQRIIQPKSDEMSQSEAFKEFGRRFVEEAIKKGDITMVRKGSGRNGKITFSRLELQKAVSERNILRCIINIENKNKESNARSC